MEIVEIFCRIWKKNQLFAKKGKKCFIQVVKSNEDLGGDLAEFGKKTRHRL